MATTSVATRGAPYRNRGIFDTMNSHDSPRIVYGCPTNHPRFRYGAPRLATKATAVNRTNTVSNRTSTVSIRRATMVNPH